MQYGLAPLNSATTALASALRCGPTMLSVKIVNHLYTPVYTLMAFRPSYLPSAGGPR